MLFTKFGDINETEFNELKNDFTEIMTKHSFNKKHVLHKEGTICNRLFIIKTGLVRSFYHKDGKDITAHFAPENDTITAIDSFIQRKRSRYNIEVLEDSEVWIIEHKDLLELLNRKPKYEKHLRMFVEQVYIQLVERLEDIMFNSAKERYANLINKHPSLLQRVNLEHIASIIGITQETLSRIRA